MTATRPYRRGKERLSVQCGGRLSPAEARKFDKRCKRLKLTRANVVRRLIVRWLDADKVELP
jgi:hypothetical protein